jgi:hypothetical protein
VRSRIAPREAELGGVAHRVLDRLSQTAKREAFEAFIDFLMTPAFGSWSKREIELKVFELLYRDHLDSVSVGEVAAELSVTRSRARSLLLETRTRLIAAPEQREQALRNLLVNWPSEAEIDQTSRRLRLVVDDPFVRDLLKNHAYTEGLLLDTSFASEIISLRWIDYARLLSTVVSDADARELEKAVGAEIRKKLADDEAARVGFDEQLEKWKNDSATARRRVARALQTGVEYVPVGTVASVVVGALT